MPLNRPPLALGQGARGVQDARRWVADLCAEIGRPELAECAQLGVSELVTNALLHGEPPITVRVRGTARAPAGRGARLLGRGADPPERAARPARDRRPAAHLRARAEHRGPVLRRLGRGDRGRRQGRLVRAGRASSPTATGVPGVITGVDHSRLQPTPTRDRVRVDILDVPLALYVGFQHHFRELRREVRLLALAHETDYPLAKSLSDLFALAGPAAARRHRRRADRGRAGPGPGVDRPGRAHAASHRAPRCCASSSCSTWPTSSAARSGCCRWPAAAEQRKFQAWFLSEFVRQANGEPPLSWLEARSNGHANVVT